MIWNVKGLEIPTHLEKSYFNLLKELTLLKCFDPYPYIPMIILSFSTSPFPLGVKTKETLYLNDLLGEGGLIMNRLVEEEGLLYWGSSRLEQIFSPPAQNHEDPPFAPGRGLLLGRVDRSWGQAKQEFSLPEVNWKKARVLHGQVDFSPYRTPHDQEHWPRAVRWKF